ncbi:MAG: PIN domain-containing protein [Verrucomicrobiia bacterium]
MDKVLIDTSAWIECFRPQGKLEIQERIGGIVIEGRAAWCDMIYLELCNGVRNNEEKQSLQQLYQDITLLPITPEVWRIAFEIAKRCRGKGYTIPVTDIVIAACASHYKATIESLDSHFDVLRKFF